MADKKVLVVDDDEDFVEVVQLLLESEGYEVVDGYSGQEARELAVEELPDLVILDVMMETKSAGFKAARWLRRQEATKDIPVVLLTAVNQEYPFHFGPEAAWLPVDCFLEKPVSPERLLAEVEKVLQK